MSPPVPHPHTSRPAILRTAEDEIADQEQLSENIRKEAYKQWPNEAGFDGLTEERGPIELTVQGDIPPWAAGALYRTGPGNCKIEGTPKGTYYVSHWFDGFAHTHRFEIVAPSDSDGPGARVRVLYSSRRQSDHVVAAIKANSYGGAYSFGQKRDPCIGLFGKIMSFFQAPPRIPGNICVTVNANIPTLVSAPISKKDASEPSAGHRSGANTVWLSTDATPMMEVDAETLEPVGMARQFKLHPDLKGPVSCAHAQRDPENGDYYNFNLDFGKSPTYRIFRASTSRGKTDIIATISEPAAKAAYIHSFFLTANYVVLCIPVSHFGLNGLKVAWEKNILDAIEPLTESKTCRWYVIDRRGDRGVVASFDSPSRFFFHTVNAFEETVEGGSAVDVFCEVVDYTKSDVLYSFYYDNLLDRDGAAKNFWAKDQRLTGAHPSLSRYRLRIPLPGAQEKAGDEQKKAAGEVATAPSQPEILFSIPAPHVGELPIINPSYRCKRHRFVYTNANRGLSTLLDSIVKTDVVDRTALIWEGPPGHTPGEPIFIPRPSTDGSVLDEDDGVILSLVLDGTSQRSYLLCLDAKTMEESGRADCTFAVGFGFHGIHTPTIA